MARLMQILPTRIVQRCLFVLAAVLLNQSALVADEVSVEKIPFDERGWLAFGFHHVDGSTSGSEGESTLVVHHLVPEGPAAKAGLQEGDVITSIDSEAIRFENADDPMEFFARIKPGQVVSFGVSRSEGQRTIAVVAAQMPREVFDHWQVAFTKRVRH